MVGRLRELNDGPDAHGDVLLLIQGRSDRGIGLQRGDGELELQHGVLHLFKSSCKTSTCSCNVSNCLHYPVWTYCQEARQNIDPHPHQEGPKV